MLFSFAILLAVISTTVEFFTIGQFKFHRRMCAAHSNLGIVYATAVSMMLSIEIGHLFGAAGLIAMTGGMISTVLSVGVYRAIGEAHNPVFQAKLQKYRKDWDSTKQLAKDTWRVIYFILRVITFPLWGYRAIKAWCTKRWEWCQSKYYSVRHFRVVR